MIDDYFNLCISTITKGNKINAISIRHVLYASNLEVQLLALIHSYITKNCLRGHTYF